MTYLGFPRLHFAGQFQADPSTVNNDPAHFDDARFRPRFQQPAADMTDGWWNPGGTGAWRVIGCEITSVASAQGVTAASPLADALVGGRLAGAGDRVSAKLVDLDPEQQLVSQIWGLRLQVADSRGRPGFMGTFKPAAVSDLWFRYPAGTPDLAFGGAFQSVLTDVEWADEVASEVLRELRQVSGDRLSIKFNVDGYNVDHTSAAFTLGRMVGSIGPYADGEPDHFVAGRWLRPPDPSNARLNAAPCRIDDATGALLLDLGNSIPTTAPGGPLEGRLGVVHVVAFPLDGPPVALATLETVEGPFYTRHAGILGATLSDAQRETAARSRIGLVDATGSTLHLAENEEASYVRADQSVFRMAPGAPDNTAATTLFATRFGRPEPDLGVAVFLDPSSESNPAKEGPVTGPPVGRPGPALSFPGRLTTGPDGRAELALTASDPGNPRGFIDGQIYTVIYGWGQDASVAGNQLSVLVWDDYPVPDRPTWIADVQPIFQQYANLYPAMRDILDLSDYHSVLAHRDALRTVMSLPVEDPNYMPVTRDLSPAKRAVVLKWLSDPDPPLFTITDVPGLHRILEVAIQLEHATIPAYLCALLSIKPGRNVEVARTIRHVVLQEMLHMGLMCNLLNAVGGEPHIDRPGFIPRYPGHLPGSLRPEFTVTLRKCTKEHIRDVFMAIEQPEETLPSASGLVEDPQTIDTRGIEVDAQGLAAVPAGLVEQLERQFTTVNHHPFTIGWFYDRIAQGILELSGSGVDLFVGDPARQLTPAHWVGSPGHLYSVTDSSSALLAIHEIVRQGEGTSLTDPTDERQELSHYFRFEEIVRGRQMVRREPGNWVFEGPEIRFHEDGVFDMVDDPDTASLPPGSRVRFESELCDQIYGDLLGSLQRAVSGAPEALGAAVGHMFALEVQARRLMSLPAAPGSSQVAGPSFQAAIG